MLAEASRDGDEILLVDVDLEEVSRARREWAYYVRDRRTATYDGLLQPYRARDPEKQR